MLLIPNIDHICAFLESGKNVVTTTGFVFPQFNNGEVDRRPCESCEKGQKGFYSSGLNPGVVDEILPLSLSRVCESWDTVYIAEYAWMARYPSAPMLFDMMGFGKTQEEIDNGAAKDMPLMTELFSAGCAAFGHELGVEIDEVREEREFVMTDQPLEIHAGSIEAGTMAGQRRRWTGYVKACLGSSRKPSGSSIMIWAKAGRKPAPWKDRSGKSASRGVRRFVASSRFAAASSIRPSAAIRQAVRRPACPH